jgi:hypothetical protein
MTATRDYFADGDLEILTSGDSLLVTFPLSAVGGTVATGAWTFSFGAGSTASHTSAAGAGGTAAKAQIKTSGGDGHLTGLTVGTAATDIILDNLSIASGQNVTINSAAITHAT